MKFPYRSKLSSRKIKLDPTKSYSNVIDLKPPGFWYSFRRQWYDFCKAEGLPYNYRYLYEVKLKPNRFTDIHNPDESKVLVITDWEALLKFKRTYFKDTINDWTNLVSSFAGVEFHNYVSLRNRLKRSPFKTFMSSLDVACGVIWDLSVIKELEEHEVL